MTGRAVADHLVLMARSGLMTHVAELDPPVTAAGMERFRADAAAQASNVMALSSGTFAICLSDTSRGVATRVPHRLRPIGDVIDGVPPPAEVAVPGTAPAQQPREGGEPSPEPRRILPPSLRQAAHVPTADPAPSHYPVPAQPGLAVAAHPPAATIPAARSPNEEPVLVAVLERLASRLDALETRLNQLPEEVATNLPEAPPAAPPDTASKTDLSALGTRVADAVATGISHLSEQSARAQAELDAAAQAREGRAKAHLDTLGVRLDDALAAEAQDRTDDVANLRQQLKALAGAQTEEHARTSESFATLRLGMRALNDRLADFGAQITALAPAEPLPERRGSGADVTLLHADMHTGLPVSAEGAEDARERRLRTALGALLDELGQSAPVASPSRRAGTPDR